MSELLDLSGKQIIIMGASSGIGRQTAISLSEVGAQVTLIARREKELAETKSMLKGEGHTYYVVDLCELDRISNLFDSMVEKHGKYDGLVYSAGIVDLRPYNVAIPKSVENVMKINFFAFYESVRQFAKKNNSNNKSKIVVVSSRASVRPAKGQSAYAASKAAIEASILVLAQELMNRKININSVRPGWVETPLTKDLSNENRMHEMNRQPLGPIPSEDIAKLIIYLLGSSADFITGRSFDIEGGNLCLE